MQAAHHTAEVPLLIRQVFNGIKRAGDTGMKKYEQPDAADKHDPEEKYGQCAQVIQWIRCTIERTCHRLLQDSQKAPPQILDMLDHFRRRARRIWRTSLIK